MNFKELGLCPEILQAIEDLGYEEATPIQVKAIPPILEGRDMVGSAQTGTGKTAAFVLPMLENLLSTPRSRPKLPRALILTPTRELALQVFQDLEKFSNGTGLSIY